jgi:hypothetical protein
MKKIKKCCVVILLFISVSCVQAQSPGNSQLLGQLNTIATAVPFLMIAPDARSAGMGETGVASSPDMYSMHWNVAKLAFADKKAALGISYTPWLRALVPDINLAYISGYAKLDSVSAVSASMRYFSRGVITVTGASGTIGQYKPNEFAIDLGYSRKIAKSWSVGIAGRYIRSNVTNGISMNGRSTYPGQTFAADLGAYYSGRDPVQIFNRPGKMMFGVAITNIGGKISYSDSTEEFLPINLRIGEGVSIEINSKNRLSMQLELNKLLVPTNPVYALNANGSPAVNSSGQYIILAGKDPNVSVPQGMVQSFYDAPDGIKEEIAEINFCFGAEYWYNNMFAVRTGYFYEAPMKGNRQFVTLGAGVKYNVFGLDFAYLIPTNGQRSPLQNTVRFSLSFDFNSPKASGMKQNKVPK